MNTEEKPEQQQPAEETREVEQTEQQAEPQEGAGEQQEGPATEEKAGGAGRAVFTIVLLVIIAIALISIAKNISKSRQQAQGPAGGAAMSCGMMGPEGAVPGPIGSAQAKVKVVVVLSKQAGAVMAQLASVLGNWPDQAHGEFYLVNTPEGKEVLKNAGLDPNKGAVIINGTCTFTVKTAGGAEKKIALQGPLGKNWTGKDLIAALKKAFQDAYGKTPERFDTLVAPIESVSLAGPCSCPASAEEGAKAKAGAAAPASKDE